MVRSCRKGEGRREAGELDGVGLWGVGSLMTIYLPISLYFVLNETDTEGLGSKTSQQGRRG